ncbi:hypothetical protein DL771_000048 [Monosporascus sp. 5C6A]|nr:hypothetical protein DL771_000048 [Monosporascus sp. 5C6A]
MKVSSTSYLLVTKDEHERVENGVTNVTDGQGGVCFRNVGDAGGEADFENGGSWASERRPQAAEAHGRGGEESGYGAAGNTRK